VERDVPGEKTKTHMGGEERRGYTLEMTPQNDLAIIVIKHTHAHVHTARGNSWHFRK